MSRKHDTVLQVDPYNTPFLTSRKSETASVKSVDLRKMWPFFILKCFHRSCGSHCHARLVNPPIVSDGRKDFKKNVCNLRYFGFMNSWKDLQYTESDFTIVVSSWSHTNCTQCSINVVVSRKIWVSGSAQPIYLYVPENVCISDVIRVR